MENLLLGIDIGTSGLKIAVFSPDEGLISSLTEGYQVDYPHPGWAEQNPVLTWKSVVKGLNRLWSETSISAKDIAAIGVDAQSWACIPIDREGHVLASTPIWMDTRADAICRREVERIGAERIFRTAQNPFKPSYTTPKILWFRENKPEIYAKTSTFLQYNAYIVYQLTGIISQDLSQSYGLHVVDMQTGEYDTELADLLGIDLTKLAEKNIPCDSIVGGVSQKASKETGLMAGTPVVAGGLDAACGTLGAGVILPGQTQEQGGTAGGMSICTETGAGDPRLIMSHHVVPGRWLLQGGTAGGGASLDWIVRECGEIERIAAEEEGRGVFEKVSELAETIPAGSEGLIFLPYLSGERSPIWDPQARGVFFGLGFDKTRAHMYRAVMEGVAYALRHNLETALETGARVDALYSMGGGANSLVWTQLKSDITGLTIHVPATDTATTLGAAILAGVGTGIYQSYEEAIRCHVKIRRTHIPDKKNKALYDRGYNIYRSLYMNTRELMHQL